MDGGYCCFKGNFLENANFSEKLFLFPAHEGACENDPQAPVA